MAGRVLAFLMLSTASQVSSGDIARALRVSAGSVSTATRELAEAGCIRQIAVPGSRGHYFRSADDVCGAFLVAEQRRHHVNVAFAEELMGILDPDETKPLKRLANMRDYHAFLDRSHLRLRHEWEELKRRRDAARHHE
ncbi:GbsR/MarR family transcriptional regulator [Phytoactinopolyspora halotolerans]|uniref:MarR family transcriptional regulator n=1 Tax=Phytoactinopolyspora halotolerans TaxID=1981512 RepID=A0A6L9SCV7_9ACTN|nr:MarR family transcriptional regulator [Phytoactinopolyspora halotolerans]NEE02408.1 MarR family transcriptional regulator [Phytoactinopolyspora halotolerans]